MGTGRRGYHGKVARQAMVNRRVQKAASGTFDTLGSVWLRLHLLVRLGDVMDLGRVRGRGGMVRPSPGVLRHVIGVARRCAACVWERGEIHGNVNFTKRTQLENAVTRFIASGCVNFFKLAFGKRTQLSTDGRSARWRRSTLVQPCSRGRKPLSRGTQKSEVIMDKALCPIRRLTGMEWRPRAGRRTH